MDSRTPTPRTDADHKRYHRYAGAPSRTLPKAIHYELGCELELALAAAEARAREQADRVSVPRELTDEMLLKLWQTQGPIVIGLPTPPWKGAIRNVWAALLAARDEGDSRE